MGGRFFFARYRPGLVGLLKTPQDWLGRLQTLASFSEPPEIEVIVFHRPTRTPIGAICLTGIDAANGKAEFSVGFLRGRGTRAIWEAIHYALNYSFETLGLRKLVLHALADNRQALAILERVGAHREGVFRDELVLPGGTHADLWRFALFRESDWPRLRSILARIAPLAHG